MVSSNHYFIKLLPKRILPSEFFVIQEYYFPVFVVSFKVIGEGFLNFRGKSSSVKPYAVCVTSEISCICGSSNIHQGCMIRAQTEEGWDCWERVDKFRSAPGRKPKNYALIMADTLKKSHLSVVVEK